MIHASKPYVPVLTSPAGLCLTAANWQEVGVTTASFYLDALLQKPGFALLKKIENLHDYLGWQETIILNASTLRANKEGIFQVISPYDGSKIKFTYQQLIELIWHLKPNIVLLPLGITYEAPQAWDDWPEEIIPFVSVEEQIPSDVKNYGLYFKNGSSLELMEQRPCYVMGVVTLDEIGELKDKAIAFIESDAFANAAMQGIVYSQNEQIDIKEEKYSQQFEAIDSSCACPTCSQKLTKAYLHHLLANTPLLAQRFLMQHNVYVISNVVRHLPIF